MAPNQVVNVTLTRREREIAALVAEGLTNRDIAKRMFISERTVDGHLEHIREKLGVRSRAQVAAWYVAQPAAGAGPVAVRSPARRSRRALAAIVAAAALAGLAVLGLVAWPRLLTSAEPAGPKVTTFQGAAPAAQLVVPLAVAIGGDGSVYVADWGNSAIKKIDPVRATIVTIAGGHDGTLVDGGDALQTPIGHPAGLAVAPDGVVFFTNGSVVGRIATDGTVHLVLAAPIMDPNALCIAADGTLYISDRLGNRVWRRAPDGTLSPVAGSGQKGFEGDFGAATAAALNHPRAVALDADGSLLIADTGNNRIRRVDRRSSVITTIAGSSDIYGFAGDGHRADQALLSLPYGLAVGLDGSLYIADTGNHRVRRVSKLGTITTVVGGKDELSGPAGLAITASGDLYIADFGDYRIHVVRGLTGP